MFGLVCENCCIDVLDSVMSLGLLVDAADPVCPVVVGDDLAAKLLLMVVSTMLMVVSANEGEVVFGVALAPFDMLANGMRVTAVIFLSLIGVGMDDTVVRESAKTKGSQNNTSFTQVNVQVQHKVIIIQTQ